MLSECVNVKIGRGVFRSIPVPAARVRPTVTDAFAVRTLVRRAPLMVRVVVMAYRVAPGFASTRGALAGKKGFATQTRHVDLLSACNPVLSQRMDRGGRHKVTIPGVAAGGRVPKCIFPSEPILS